MGISIKQSFSDELLRKVAQCAIQNAKKIDLLKPKEEELVREDLELIRRLRDERVLIDLPIHGLNIRNCILFCCGDCKHFYDKYGLICRCLDLSDKPELSDLINQTSTHRLPEIHVLSQNGGPIRIGNKTLDEDLGLKMICETLTSEILKECDAIILKSHVSCGYAMLAKMNAFDVIHATLAAKENLKKAIKFMLELGGLTDKQTKLLKKVKIYPMLHVFDPDECGDGKKSRKSYLIDQKEYFAYLSAMQEKYKF
jgi:hypothetical protein